MHWWYYLTPGQATLLGGLAVLGAGILAFSTGWFQRREDRRRYHYEELKELYSEGLEIGSVLSQLPTNFDRATKKGDAEALKKLTELSDEIISRTNKLSAKLRLTGDTAVANMLENYMAERITTARIEQAKASGAELDQVDQNPPKAVSYNGLMKVLRLELARLVPMSRTSLMLRGYSPNREKTEVDRFNKRANYMILLMFIYTGISFLKPHIHAGLLLQFLTVLYWCALGGAAILIVKNFSSPVSGVRAWWERRGWFRRRKDVDRQDDPAELLLLSADESADSGEPPVSGDQTDERTVSAPPPATESEPQS